MGYCSVCNNPIAGGWYGMITICCDYRYEYCDDCLTNVVFRGGMNIELQKKIMKEISSKRGTLTIATTKKIMKGPEVYRCPNCAVPVTDDTLVEGGVLSVDTDESSI